MSTIFCHVGQVGSISAPKLPVPFRFGNQASDLESLFASSSNQDIQLQFDYSGLAVPFPSNGNLVPAYHLHLATRSLTKNPTSPSLVDHIALLFCGTYAGAPSALGVMFDRGFVTYDDPNVGPSAVPREGCAVFLDAILQFLISNGVDPHSEYQAKAIFAVIHELGHVFNLQHESSTPSFLIDSPQPGPQPQAYWQFTGQQQWFLSKCSSSRGIHPGGRPFGDLGDLAPLSSGSAFLDSKGRNPDLEIEIMTSQNEFFRCEPIELQFEVRLRKDSRSDEAKVINEFDPGYASFAIWIKDPAGDIRKYRSTKHFCEGTSSVKIGKHDSFQRDVSIFGQSGGYTFQSSGSHLLWITCKARGGKIIKSNELDVFVLPQPRRGARLQERYRALRTAAREFFYRSGRAGRAGKAALSYLSQNHEGNYSGAVAHYTLGRLLLDGVQIGSRRHKRKINEGLEHLCIAANSSQLGSHQREVAACIIGRFQN